MKRILILEDDSIRAKQFQRNLIGNLVVVVAKADLAINQLATEHPWDAVFLDHDLGGNILVESGPGTGYEVACWLEEHPEKCPKLVVVHSFNPAGADKMMQALPKAIRCAGIWDQPSTLAALLDD